MTNAIQKPVRTALMLHAGWAMTFIGLVALPEMAWAISYDTIVQLLRDFVRMLFVDAGPYIFMAAFGVSLVGIGKGWIPVKAGVILIVVCFCFFAVPAGVRYLQQQASLSI